MRAMDILSGGNRGVGAAALRGGLRCVEPVYAGAMTLRNRLYDGGWLAAHDLGRATISVGNLTTGGTGKTPMVQWLVERLIARGHRPAVLLRGYGRADEPGRADEVELLRELLGVGVPVEANPDRVAGAKAVLARDAGISVFVLDDGFQHRRVKRDFNLLLVSATHPFGFGHVLPRGLLREPVAGASRADAIVITRADRVDEAALAAIQARLPDRPIYLARHALGGLRGPDGPRSLSWLAGRRYVAFSGIGEPDAFFGQLRDAVGEPAGVLAFADHHEYGESSAAELIAAMKANQAEALVTTRKDGVKLARIVALRRLPIFAVEMTLGWLVGDGGVLVEAW